MPKCGNYLWSSLELIKETVINHKAFVDIATNTTGIRFNLRESKQVNREQSGKMSLPVPSFVHNLVRRRIISSINNPI